MAKVADGPLTIQGRADGFVSLPLTPQDTAGHGDSNCTAPSAQSWGTHWDQLCQPDCVSLAHGRGRPLTICLSTSCSAQALWGAITLVPCEGVPPHSHNPTPYTHPTEGVPPHTHHSTHGQALSARGQLVTAPVPKGRFGQCCVPAEGQSAGGEEPLPHPQLQKHRKRPGQASESLSHKKGALLMQFSTQGLL